MRYRHGFVVLLLTLCPLLAVNAEGGELTVTTVEPASHSLGAAVTSAITVHFDRPVAVASVGPASFWAFGRWSGTVSGSYSFTDGGATVSLTPALPFSAGESVMVFLSHDLEAVDGSFLRAAGYSFQFWVRARAAGLDFVEIDRLETGPSQPYGGIGSDLDGDRYLDITTVNEMTSDLRVFMNVGDGSGLFDDFIQPTTGTGNVPSPSEPTDFDRDGDVDIVAANTQAASVSILLGNGDGTFSPQQEVAMSGPSRGVAVLDVDGDGDVDIAATNRTTGLITVLRNDGAGIFGNPTTFGTGSGEEWALAAGDMTNDGILDLVVGGHTSQRVYVYAGNGDGTFTLTDDEFSGETWMLVLGDVNGDGALDVSVANGGSDTGSILLGDGAGGLGAAQPHTVDALVLATDLGDLDGDGDLDWMLASFFGDWTLLTNDGTGTFTFDREIDATAAASCSLMMDTDNDGDLDLALIDEIADEVILLRNVGTVFTDGFESGDTVAWSSTVQP